MSDSHAELPSYRWHHFDSAQQQFDSGKLGMWLFLATEVLMFGGLFCAYTIYRGNHPELFEWGAQFLDKKWGGINTIVLICSSLTMAWAVRCAQLGQKGLMNIMLVLTLLCACGFMGIKYVEYSHKIKHGLMWGTNFAPDEHALEGAHGGAHGGDHGGDHGSGAAAKPSGETRAWTGTPEASTVTPAARAPGGLAPTDAPAPPPDTPLNPQIFFGIYFVMTGLHGIHVFAGMIVITWLILISGRFGPEYFTPVDLVGLYWHIVDLIWIFLFPLLYLIH